MIKGGIVNKIEGILRAICFLMFFITCAVLVFIENLMRPLYPKIDKLCGNYFNKNYDFKIHEKFISWWEDGALKMFGVNIILDTKETVMPKTREDNVIVMFSHGSNLDPPIIHATFPQYVRFVSKKELFHVPIFGTVMKIIGQIPIDRENLAEAISSLDKTGEMVRNEHACVGIAPEGTRRRSNSIGPDQIQPFKKGPFHLAKACNVDIMPVVIMGANRLFPPKQPFPTSGNVYVKYLERIPKETVQKMSIAELQELIRNKYRENIKNIDDAIVFSKENKPYKLFIINLTLLVGFWCLIVKTFAH